MNPTSRGMLLGMTAGIFLAVLFQGSLVLGIGAGMAFGTVAGKVYAHFVSDGV